MKNKNAQSAVEFLVTYGWAVMAVLIVLGALMYFGFFDTVKFAEDKCDFGDQLRCEDFKLSEDGWVSLRLRNNFGVNINIDNVVFETDYGLVTNCNSFIFKDLINANNPLGGGEAESNVNIPISDLFEVNCQITTIPIPLRERIDIRSTVIFAKSGSSIIHNVTGNVFVTAGVAGNCTDSVRNCHGNPLLFGCEQGPDCRGDDNTCPDPGLGCSWT